MTIALSPYLNFSGNTREAMEFYHDVFGGNLHITTFAELHVPGMPADGVMHAALVTDHLSIFASEAQPGAEASWNGTRVYLSLMGDEPETLTTWFYRLAEGGRIGMPLEKQMWGDTYGLVIDRFGIEWMVNIDGRAVAGTAE